MLREAEEAARKEEEERVRREAEAASYDKDDKDNLKDLPAYLEYVQGEFSDVDVANRISMFDKELCVTDSDGDHAAEFYEVDGDLLVRTLPVENQVIMI